MIFSRSNRLKYLQDFRMHEGVPNGVDFFVQVIDRKQKKVKLTAPGYGGIPYGNGALYVFNFPMTRIEKLKV